MKTQEIAIARVLKAIDAVKVGGMVIMVDDEDRENEGDLVFAAGHVNPEKINFMTKEARGLICLSLDEATINRLKLPMMQDVGKRGGTKTTAFTVSIEARDGVSTGISAADRAQTVRVAVDPATVPDDLVVPGHIFPLKAQVGGVLQRAGHTEGSVDLARLAGLPPAAVICEIMNDDGSMARLPDLERFSARHGIPIVTIADVITFRLLRESLIEEQRAGYVDTAFGRFRAVLFKSQIDDLVHLALVKGADFGDAVVEVRVHRQRPLVDVFGGPGSVGRGRVDYGLQMLRDADAGVLIYLSHHEAQAALIEEFDRLVGTKHPPAPPKHDQAEMDPRMLGVGAQILRHLGVRRMRVHMSHPAPLKGLGGFDLEVIGTCEMTPPPS